MFVKFKARLCVQLGFHKYLMNVSEEIKKEVNDFLLEVDLDAKFKAFVRHETDVPKVLSDILESIAGAILLDGG
jgi:endoribonuclease Dicer